MKIAQDDYLKIAHRWRRNKTFDSQIFKSILLMGEMSKFLAVRQDFSPSPEFPTKVQEKEEQFTPGGCNNFVIFLVRTEMSGITFWDVILLDTVYIKGLTFN